MPDLTQQLTAFFAAYEERTNRALAEPPVMDVEATARVFTECFIAATPNGVRCGMNDQQLRDAIPNGFAFYRSIGTKSMTINALTVHPIDEFHAMATVHWEAFYRRKDGREEVIDFDVVYLLQLIGEEPRIFGYITGDEQKVYQERGLLPE